MAVESIITVPFRLAFPEIFTPKASVEGGKEKFSITMLFPSSGEKLIEGKPELYSPANADILGLRKLALSAVKDKWGEDKAKWPPFFQKLDFKTYVSPNGKDGWPLRDGNLVEWDGFANQIFVRASSQYPPGVVDKNLHAIIDKTAVFGGIIARAQVNVYAYDTAGNKGISFGLNNLQLLREDGVVFGGKSNAAEVFDAFGAADSLDSSGAPEADPFA